MIDHTNSSRWTTSQWNYWEDGYRDYEEGNKPRVIDNNIHGVPYHMGYEDARQTYMEFKDSMRHECFGDK